MTVRCTETCSEMHTFVVGECEAAVATSTGRPYGPDSDASFRDLQAGVDKRLTSAGGGTSARDLGLCNGNASCVHGKVWDCAECGTNRGMTVDGDMLRDLICDSVPRLFTDEAAGRIADDVLDAAVRAGMTVLHGPDGTPRQVVEQRGGAR